MHSIRRNGLDRRAGYVAIALIAVFIVPLAQERSQRDQAVFAKEPVAELAKGQIALRIAFPGRDPIVAIQVEGGLIRVKSDGRLWGMIPTTVAGNADEVSVALFEYQPGDPKALQVPELKEQLSARILSDTSWETAPFRIRVELIKPGAPGVNSGGATRGEENRCCISCGGTTVCACAVSAACGNCCAGPCC